MDNEQLPGPRRQNVVSRQEEDHAVIRTAIRAAAWFPLRDAMGFGPGQAGRADLAGCPVPGGSPVPAGRAPAARGVTDASCRVPGGLNGPTVHRNGSAEWQRGEPTSSIRRYAIFVNSTTLLTSGSGLVVELNAGERVGRKCVGARSAGNAL